MLIGSTVLICHLNHFLSIPVFEKLERILYTIMLLSLFHMFTKLDYVGLGQVKGVLDYESPQTILGVNKLLLIFNQFPIWCMSFSSTQCQFWCHQCLACPWVVDCIYWDLLYCAVKYSLSKSSSSSFFLPSSPSNVGAGNPFSLLSSSCTLLTTGCGIIGLPAQLWSTTVPPKGSLNILAYASVNLGPISDVCQ